MLLTIPNLLTLLRIALIPVFCSFMFDLDSYSVFKSSHTSELVNAGIVFSIAATTDFFDGYLARKWNQTSNLGKLLDPLADKLLVTAALIGLVEWHLVPSWTVVVILGREFLVTGLRGIVVESGGKAIAASNMGKFKTVLQISAVIGFLFDLGIIAKIIYALAVVLTVVSGVDYIWKSREYLMPKKNNK